MKPVFHGEVPLKRQPLPRVREDPSNEERVSYATGIPRLQPRGGSQEDMFSPECRDYLKSQRSTQQQREISKLESHADSEHALANGNPNMVFVEVGAVFENQKALRLRLESIEEKLDRLLANA